MKNNFLIIFTLLIFYKENDRKTNKKRILVDMDTEGIYRLWQHFFQKF